jgi:hypothetical protein
MTSLHDNFSWSFHSSVLWSPGIINATLQALSSVQNSELFSDQELIFGFEDGSTGTVTISLPSPHQFGLGMGHILVLGPCFPFSMPKMMMIFFQ